MGISAIGQHDRVTAVRYAVATAMVFLGLFVYFYGPPLIPNMAEAARSTCNDLTGSDYRNHRLEWRTTTYDGIDAPHWVCVDLGTPGHPTTSLGWWVDL